MTPKSPLQLVGRLTSPLTTVAGTLTEAFHQIRIGRVRLILSLVGVAVAVAAMTLVIAIGDTSSTGLVRAIELSSGRAGTVSVTVSGGSGGDAAGGGSPGGQSGSESSSGAGSGSQSDQQDQQGQSPQQNEDDPLGLKVSAPPPIDGSYVAQGMALPDSAWQSWRISQAMKSFVDSHEVSAWATSYDTQVRFAFGDGGLNVNTHVVSSQYGMLHHTTLTQGRWFRADDADDASPSLVVSPGFLDRLGISKLNEPVTVTSWSPVRTTFTIVGVLVDPNAEGRAQGWDNSNPLEAYVLDSSYERWLPADAERPAPTLKIWAGKAQSAEIKKQAEQYFSSLFGSRTTKVETNEQAFRNTSTGSFGTVVTTAGVFIMILGALGLINISVVTVRQRIHEIGVRRAFGATSQRIFFSIMLESVVATVIAGVIGIGIAVVALRYLPITDLLLGGIVPPGPPPPFPMGAALTGLLTSTGVGALAGIIPAIVAVRIKPIDAIRY